MVTSDRTRHSGWLWIVLPSMAIVLTGFAAVFAGRNPFRSPRVTAWSSASPGVDRGVGDTSFAYANPIRNVLATVLLTRSELVERARGGLGCRGVQLALTYRVDVLDLIERFFYGSVGAALLSASRWARRLQSGRLDGYMAQVLAVLAVVIVTA